MLWRQCRLRSTWRSWWGWLVTEIGLVYYHWLTGKGWVEATLIGSIILGYSKGTHQATTVNIPSIILNRMGFFAKIMSYVSTALQHRYFYFSLLV